MKYYKFLFCFLLSLLFLDCSDYSPKPIGQNRIEKLESGYVKYEFPKFSFQYSDLIHIDTLLSKNKEEYWFNIVYPQYNAVLYCSYLPIDRSSLSKVLEDSYHLAYSHTIKADDINQKIYSNPTAKIGGMIYEIDGSVATPLQFFVTDSVANFLRGSLYYSKKMDVDSVAPINHFIEEDIMELIRTITFDIKK